MIDVPEGFDINEFVSTLYTFATPVVSIFFIVVAAAVIMKALRYG